MCFDVTALSRRISLGSKSIIGNVCDCFQKQLHQTMMTSQLKRESQITHQVIFGEYATATATLSETCAAVSDVMLA